MKRCPACGAMIGPMQRLCSTCKTGIKTYPDENPAMVSAYVTAGLADIAAYLENWRLFDLYLNEKGSPR